MENTLTIQGLGRTIKGMLGPDEPYGFVVKPGGLQGWESLPAGRREAMERTLDHGEFDVPVRLPARVITIDGTVVAPTLSDLRVMCHSIRGWGATGDRFTLVVEHQGEQLHTLVRSILRDATDSGDRDGDLFVADFQVQFIAADPRRYGETRTFPETGTSRTLMLSHRGNFPAHPSIEIPNAPDAYTITSPGGTFVVSGATPGGTHRVDFRTGRVFRDEVWMPTIGGGNLWAVPEGEQWLHSLSVAGRGRLPDTFV